MVGLRGLGRFRDGETGVLPRPKSVVDLITLLSPFGAVERTVPFGLGRFAAGSFDDASACLLADGSRLFVVGRFLGGNSGPHWGADPLTWIAEVLLDPAEAAPVRFLDITADQRGDNASSIRVEDEFLYVAGWGWKEPFLSRRFRLRGCSLPTD